MTRSDLPQTPRTFLKTISVIHLALIAGQVMFALAAFAIHAKHHADTTKSKDDIFLILVPLLALAGFVGGNLIFRQLLGKAAQQSSLQEKVKVYQGALIARFALLEGPSLFATASFLLTGNSVFMVVSGLIIAYFISLRPTKEKTENDLGLSYAEKLAFDRQDEVLK